jgi:hypothetical protein
MESCAGSMSEFKFACPVCGQHITADSTTSGTPLECPTCFRKIVVPQAPASDASKFILSAAQVSKPRPTPAEAAGPAAPPPPKSSLLPLVAALVGVLCVAGAAAWFWRGKIFPKPAPPSPPAKEHARRTNAPPPPPPPLVMYPVPTNLAWTLDLTNAAIPDGVAVGSLHGRGFRCERAWVQGGLLSLRQGKGRTPDLAVYIHLFAQQGEELSGKTIEIAPDRAPPVPRVEVRWREEGQDKAQKTSYNRSYALKLVFGTVANSRLPGRLYLCLPDDEKGFVAGTFDAEIRKPPPPPKPKAPPSPPKPKS